MGTLGRVRWKWLGWVVGIAAVLIFLYLTALPGEFAVGRNDGPGLAGTYTVNGIDPTGAEYSGTAIVVATERADTYDVEWIITNAVQRGTGTVTGTSFTVDWEATSSATPGAGRTVFDIGDDGGLRGRRYIDGVGASGSEELFPDP